MITIEKFDTGFEVNGHANYDEYGKDILCAAVSALAQTGAIALQNQGGVYFKRGDKLVCFSLPNKTSQLIMDTIFIGLNQLAIQYPDHIQIKEED